MCYVVKNTHKKERACRRDWALRDGSTFGVLIREKGERENVKKAV